MHKRLFYLSALIILVLSMTACSIPGIVSDPGTPIPPARPAVLDTFQGDAPVLSVQDWEIRRAPLLRDAFQQHVYGLMPAQTRPRIARQEPLDLNGMGPNAVVEQFTIEVTNSDDPLRFYMLLVLPEGPGPHPLVVMQNFCGNRAAMPDSPKVVAVSETLFDGCNAAWVRPIIEMIFGKHINSPPVDRIIERGYALAALYPGDVVPDDAELAPSYLDLLSPTDDQAVKTSTLAAWAWLYSRALDVLEADERIDAGRTAIWGHSRHGKAALLAGAFDTRIDAVISHQSGRGGTSLTRSPIGESVTQITESYPHWFSARFAQYAGNEDAVPVDQHQLIALNAPRPIFVGIGARDNWSDPRGSFAALEGADPAYKLLGTRGLGDTTPETPDYDADLVYVRHPGGHGVTAQDWDAFLTFLDAKFMQ